MSGADKESEPADTGLGVYLHVPFCRQPKCPYCDFYCTAAGPGLIESYLDAAEKELEAQAAGPFSGEWVVENIFFGGGTPSLLDPKQAGRLIRRVQALWPVSASPEITLECNPEDLTRDRAEGYRAAGVNRLSIGCQSFDSPMLAALGRSHGVDRNYRAVEAARLAGFERVSIDLILGGPGSGKSGLLKSVEAALALKVGHLSIYGYHLDPAASGYGRPEFAPAPDESYCEQYLAVCAALEEAGWLHYEISNWAALAEEVCRNNLHYWQRRVYLGVGPAAHSFLPPAWRTWNRPDLSAWLRASAGGDHGAVRGGERLGPEQIEGERLMLGMRLADGVDIELVRRFLGPEMERELAGLAGEGLIGPQTGGRIRLTDNGYLLYDSIVALLLGESGFQLDKGC